MRLCFKVPFVFWFLSFSSGFVAKTLILAGLVFLNYFMMIFLVHYCCFLVQDSVCFARRENGDRRIDGGWEC